MKNLPQISDMNLPNHNLELEIKIETIKLEYKEITSGIKNILLIDDTVYQNEILFDSVNSDTLAIKYNYNSDKNELEKLLTDNFEFINRIGFVFDDSLMKSKQFMNTELFFTPDDLTETQTEYSNNLKFIIGIIKKFNITNLDYLVCGGLKHDNWVKYFSILNKESGVIIGASNDETGNLKYRGDWILESTNEDIANIYWDSKISNYTSTLATSTISTSTTIFNADVSGYTWPITINGGTSGSPIVITFGDDITLNSSSKYFIIGSQYIRLDGGNKTILINGVVNYPGLVLNGTEFSSNGYSNITIENINVSTSSGSTIEQGKGWICWNYFGKASSNNQIKNCSSSGAISGIASGGIFGKNSSGSATNCYSSGVISGNFSGGIFSSESSGNTVNCYSSGAISGDFSGGIYGPNSLGSAVNCYSSGAISGLFSGGINGPNSSGSTVNCYIANNSWSDVSASSNLTGIPTYDSSGSLVNPVGTTWIDIAPSNRTTPWLFSTFGFTPYTSTLTTTFTQTIIQSKSTNSALVPIGHTYSIVSINNSLPSNFPSITINSSGLTGGKINTTLTTPVGVYSIKVMQNSNYSITNFELSIEAFCFNKGTKILCLKNGVEEYIKIEELKKGDLIKTLENGYIPINAMGTNTMQNNPLSDKGSMYKYNDLIVTGCHILLKDWEKKDRNKYIRNSLVDNKYRLMACQDSRFEKIIDNKIYTIYNLVLEGGKQYGIMAEGILTETAKKIAILNCHLKKIE
jgi:hypothetical protein